MTTQTPKSGPHGFSINPETGRPQIHPYANMPESQTLAATPMTDAADKESHCLAGPESVSNVAYRELAEVIAMIEHARRLESECCISYANKLNRAGDKMRDLSRENARLREALSACEAAINMGLTLPNGELKPYATAWAGLLADTRATLAQVQS